MATPAVSACAHDPLAALQPTTAAPTVICLRIVRLFGAPPVGFVIGPQM
jgi:hypothetical protein